MWEYLLIVMFVILYKLVLKFWKYYKLFYQIFENTSIYLIQYEKFNKFS